MSNVKDFVHLHVHTEYSLLDGLSKIDKLMKRAQQLEMGAMAITDHGAMFGVIQFFRTAKKMGVKPIIGMEAYLAPRGMEDREAGIDSKPYHMLLLAKNEVGYKNLLKLASESQLRGYYYRPRMDKALMEQYSEGLIATSGCLAAEIPRMYEAGQDDSKILDMVGWYQEVFGKENFFLELQHHDIPQLDKLNRWLVRNSDRVNVPLVATNDVHYVMAEDYDPHDTLLCIQTGNVKNEKDRMRMTDPSYHLTTQEEMWRAFHEVPDALTNTVRIAEMCDVDLDTEGYHLPVFPVPEGYNEQTYLRYLCDKGLRWRYGSQADDPEIQQRLDYELGIIHDMGFDTYFLIVWDLCEFARHADIWWNVRGSGAGSVAAYSLGITSIDPLRNSLIFERFLNPGRVSMPDIDLDYPDDRRAEMIAYTSAKYGEDKVAAIITFGTMGSKAAIRDVGRAFEMPLADVNRIAGMLPSGAKPVKFKDALSDDKTKNVQELIDAYNADPAVKRLIDTAKSLEGVVRHASTHAAGVIVSDKPLTEYIPLHRVTKGAAEDAPVKQVTQFDMETSESLGLLKVDFLGLATLTIMRKACELVEKYHGIHYTMENIPYRPDPNNPETTRLVNETFEMIGRGETIGVFQIESTGMRKMLTEMRPRTFEHIIAAISLYRPGPMEQIPKFNRRLHEEEQPTYLHDKLKPILAETYGIIVYQEQIMQIAADLFGYSLGEADLMRRAVSKKKEKELLKHKSIFIEQGPQNGVDAASAEKIFDDIEFFARYGFNKSHAADYAVITCQTAFLKTHYPVEYMTGLLSVQRDDTAKVSHFTAECRRMGIPILPPDVNHSDLDFTIETNADGVRGIRYGMAAIKNVGAAPIQHIIDMRAEGGTFEDLGDFCKRVDLRIVQKRALESLIRVGALKDFGTRPQLLAALDRMLSYSADQHRAKDVGQLSLFGETTGVSFDAADDMLAHLPEIPEATEREMLSWEKELVGLYVTSHPLDTVIDYIQHPNSVVVQSREIKDDPEHYNGRQVSLVGLVDSVRSLMTKRGDPMGVLTMEDLQGQIEAVIFPRTWAEYKELVQQDAVVRIVGKADASRGEAQIIVDSVSKDFTIIQSADEHPVLTTMEMPEWLRASEEERYAPSGEAEQDDDNEEDAEEEAADERPPEPVKQVPPPPPPPPAYVASATAGAAPGAPNLVAQIVEPQARRMSLDKRPVWAVDAERLPSYEAESEPELAGMLTVRFERSEDEAKDRRRLRRIHGKLTSFPGVDRFRIVICGPQGEVVMDFPNHTTGYSEGLAAELRGMSGVEINWEAECVPHISADT